MKVWKAVRFSCRNTTYSRSSKSASSTCASPSPSGLWSSCGNTSRSWRRCVTLILCLLCWWCVCISYEFVSEKGDGWGSQRMWLHSHGAGEAGAGELLRSSLSHLARHLTSGCSGGDDPVMNALCIALEKSLAEFTVSVFTVNESLRLPSNIHDH